MHLGNHLRILDCEATLRLLISAGGTGGGVYPALAVVDVLNPSVEVLWVGSMGGMESSLVNRAGMAFEAVPAAGVHGVGLRALPGNLLQLARGIPAASRIIRRYKPNVLLFTGGFVGIPVALAGWRLPKVMYAPDIEPGLALRMIGKLSDVITVSTETSRAFYPSSRRVVVTGYPTRQQLNAVERTHARRDMNLDSERPVVLMFGGSRGARSINNAIWGCLTELLEVTQVLHVTGELDWPRVDLVRDRIPPSSIGDYHAFSYLHEEMFSALAAADLVVSRAGAATLGEYPLLGLPAVLIPYPHAWRFQRTNAEYLEARGAAVILVDEALEEELKPTVLGLLGDPERLEAMGAAARKLATPDAASLIASQLKLVANMNGGAHA